MKPRRAPVGGPELLSFAAGVLAGLIALGVLAPSKKPKELSVEEIAQILQGTPTAKAREDARAQELGLRFYGTVEDIRRARERGALVPVLDAPHYNLDPKMGAIVRRDLRPIYQALRPSTKRLLDEITRDYVAQFGVEPTITSLTRSLAYVRRLSPKNPNASPTSTHMTGAAFDIGYKDMTPEQRAWLGAYLARMEAEGRIEAIKEVGQACFHVFDRHAR